MCANFSSRSEYPFVFSIEESSTDEPFLQDVLAGLSKPQKSIASKYFYDEAGSRLFDEICELVEYYPTRTEMRIMQQNIEEIVRLIGSHALVIEYGSGSSLKTRILLENLYWPAGYIPIDISREHLHRSADELRAEFPELEVLPVHADYSSDVQLPRPSGAVSRKLVYFPGSTIGNFTRDESIAFLERLSGMCDSGDGLLIGVDLKKDREILERAYNDAKGVTAAFNLNLLRRINRELGANFDLAGFEHKAVYDADEGRIEMHLFSTADQRVTIQDQVFSLKAGESIHTENSYKYSLSEFASIGRSAGFRVERVWTDPRCLFSIQFLKVV